MKIVDVISLSPDNIILCNIGGDCAKLQNDISNGSVDIRIISITNLEKKNGLVYFIRHLYKDKPKWGYTNFEKRDDCYYINYISVLDDLVLETLNMLYTPHNRDYILKKLGI